MTTPRTSDCTSPSSWTGTAGGPKEGACRAILGTAPGLRPTAWDAPAPFAPGFTLAEALLIPTRLYFNDRGRAKLELGLAKGKHHHDKREATKTRDWNRDKARIMRERG